MRWRGNKSEKTSVVLMEGRCVVEAGVGECVKAKS